MGRQAVIKRHKSRVDEPIEIDGSSDDETLTRDARGPASLPVFPEKETPKGKYKNPKVQKSKRYEIVKSNNRIIQKSKSSNMQKM